MARPVAWLSVFSPLLIQMVYSKLYCNHALLPSSVPVLIVSLPTIIWLMRKRYIPTVAASAGAAISVIWENHVQCISQNGPFVGGLGPIYLLIFGLLGSSIMGFIAGWVSRRFRE